MKPEALRLVEPGPNCLRPGLAVDEIAQGKCLYRVNVVTQGACETPKRSR